MTYLADEYAAVLFQLGIKEKDCEDFVQKLTECPELLAVLDNPSVSRQEKHRVIEKVFNDGITAFIKCLCDNGRIQLYKEIYEAYLNLKNKQNGIIEADFVCTAVPEKAELDKIKAMLIKKYNKKDACIRVRQDRGLLGGFVLKVGDTEYDKSMIGAINNLKRKLEWR